MGDTTGKGARGTRSPARGAASPITGWRVAAALALVLIVAAALRFYGLDWDQGLGAHPDERHVVAAAEALRWPECLNPLAIDPDLAYGHGPIYLLAAAAGFVRGVDPLLVGRSLAALLDLGTVVLAFALARRMHGPGVGLLAAAFVAVTLLHVQQAHFYTVDTAVTFLSVGALLWGVRLAQAGRAIDAWGAGLWAGLAVGTKASAALLALPLAAACALAPVRRRLRWRRGAAVAVAGVATFAVTNPFALAAFPAWCSNVAREAAIARGALDVPYTRQFHGTWPYLYPVAQQLIWGMGPVLGLVAFAGLGVAAWQAVRRPPGRAQWVLLAWTVPGFALVGALYAKFPRYLLPLVPVLMTHAAEMVLGTGRRGRRVRWLGALLIWLCASLHCSLLVGLYRSAHPWLEASEWFHQHAARGAVVAVEEWDHPLPVGGGGRYRLRELPVFEEDAPGKWAEMEAVLAEADYVIVASRRGYSALARWPERYPRTTRYYERLFWGDLGFEPVACFGRAPGLGPVAVADDPAAGLPFSLPGLCRPEAAYVVPVPRLDESFVVYDHPRVLILHRAADQ